MNKARSQLSITVGIPTRYGDGSLIKVVDSIKENRNFGKTQIRIIADSVPLSKTVKSGLKKRGVSLTWITKPETQFSKIRRLIRDCNSEIFISTQDDVIFAPETLSAVRQAFLNPHLTMASVRVLPLPPENRTEAALASMARIVDRIGHTWNAGRNHLSVSGRCLVFRTKHLKKFRFPDTVVTGDMYMYYENSRLNGQYRSLNNARVFIRCPQSIKDQIGPSSRYQNSKNELRQIFGNIVTRDYRIPPRILTLAVFNEFLHNPLPTLYYLPVYILTRIRRNKSKRTLTPMWSASASTKKI